MADYGITRFGTGFTYGESNSSGVYYNSGLTATTTDYSQVKITWNAFTVDPADVSSLGATTNWYWMLVKSYTGTHDNPMDGIYLTGGSYTSSWSTSYVDVDTSVAGAQVSYSLWVFAGNGTTTGKWIFCGADYSYIISDTGTLNTLTSWIPRSWLNSGEALGQNDSSNTLVQTLSAFAFTYDKLRLEGALLAKNNVQSLIPSQLLQYELSNFGFSPEPALGDTYHRTLIAAGNSIYKYKGTLLGVQTYISALTHLNSSISASKNLLLAPGDFSGGDFSWVSSNNTTAQGGAVIAPPANILTASSPPAPASSYPYDFLITNSTTPVTLSLPGPSIMNDPQKGILTYGVPVKGTTAYVFSGWVADNGVSANITVDISWYDQLGNLISTYVGAVTWATTTAWKQFTSDLTTGPYFGSLQSPSNAVVAALTIHVTPSSSTSTSYMFTSFQFSEGKYGYLHEEIGCVSMYLQGEKENYIPNPSFDSVSTLGGDLTGWFGYGGTLSIESSLNKPAFVYTGYECAKLTVTSSTDAAFVTDWISVDPGKIYTASAYVAGSRAVGASVRIEYSSQPTLESQVQILSDANGQYYPTTTNIHSSSGATAAITNAIGGGTAVVYTADNTFQVGQSVTISGVTPTTFNLTNQVITAVTSFDFTVSNTVVDTYVSGGTATINATTLSTSALTRISVTCAAPPAGIDVGNPVCKVHIYFPSVNSGDSYWVDAVMLEDSYTPSDFFSGNGGRYPTNPLTKKYYSPSDCSWESKPRYNYISNPAFASNTTDWVMGTGTSFVRNSVGSASPWGGFQSTLTLAAGVGDVTVTGYFPYYPEIGRDYVFSAYVRGFTGTVTTSIPSLSTYGDAVTTQVIDAFTAGEWTRVSCRGVAIFSGGSTTIQANLSFSGSSIAYISGAQLEFGRIATDVVEPSASTTRTIANPTSSGSGKNLYATMVPSKIGVKSSYVYNAPVKTSRVLNNLSLVLPLGVSYNVHVGKPTSEYTEIAQSLLASPSFENMFDFASLNGATIYRAVSKGVILGDAVTQGQAYLTALNSTPATTFGAQQVINGLTSGTYYISAAIRPGANATSGTYTIDATFYDDSETIWVAPTITRTFNQVSRWNYIAGTYPASSIAGAESVLIKIAYNSGSANTNQAFRLDRVVFRH